MLRSESISTASFLNFKNYLLTCVNWYKNSVHGILTTSSNHLSLRRISTICPFKLVCLLDCTSLWQISWTLFSKSCHKLSIDTSLWHAQSDSMMKLPYNHVSIYEVILSIVNSPLLTLFYVKFRLYGENLYTIL